MLLAFPSSAAPRESEPHMPVSLIQSTGHCAASRYITRTLASFLLSPRSIRRATSQPTKPVASSDCSDLASSPSSELSNGRSHSRCGRRGGGGSEHGAEQRRRAEDAALGGGPQEPPPERRAVPVHPGDERLPARARVHEGAPRGHLQAPMEPDDDVGGRGAVPQHAGQAHRREEDDGDRRVHRLLPPRHRARHPRRRHDLGHGRQPRELRAGASLHREGRRGAQDRLPRGPGAAGAGRARRRRGQPRRVRLRLRRRRQGQLPQLPRAADEAGEGRRPRRLRQHALERLRRAPRRRPHAQVHPLLPRLRPRPQQGPRRRPPRRDLPAPRRRRHHPLPPRQVIKSPAPRPTDPRRRYQPKRD